MNDTTTQATAPRPCVLIKAGQPFVGKQGPISENAWNI